MSAIEELLAPIKEREETANEGPWFANRYYIGAGEDHSDPDTEIGKAGTKADAAFIAAARTDVPRLVAALEAGESAIVWMVEHFREGLDRDNPEGMQHVANSNRAFGAGIALDSFRDAVMAALAGLPPRP